MGPVLLGLSDEITRITAVIFMLTGDVFGWLVGTNSDDDKGKGRM